MKTTPKAAEVQGTKAAQNVSTKPELSNLKVSPTQDTKQEEKPSIKVLTVEDRRGRTEVFTKLLDKHENLKGVQQRVESFAVGSDEHSQSLELRDSKGNHFKTGNPLILKEIISLIRSHIVVQVDTVETDILNFTI